MSEELKIEIVGSLNPTATTSEINSQLKDIKKSVDDLNLSIKLDSDSAKVLKGFSEDFKKIENLAKETGKVIEKSILPDGTKVSRTYFNGIKNEFSQVVEESKKVSKEISHLGTTAEQTNKKVSQSSQSLVTQTDKLHSSLEEAVREYSKLGTVQVKQNLNPLTRDLESFILTVKKADDTVEKLKFTMKELETPSGVTKGFQVQDIKISDNRQQLSENVLKEEQKISKAIDDQNKKIEHQLEMRKQDAKNKVDDLKRRYGNKISPEAESSLNSYLSRMNGITATTPEALRQVEKLNSQLRGVESNLKTAASRAVSFGEQLSVAMSRIPIWFVGMTAFYAPLQLLQDSITQIIELDSQLTTLKRVSGDATNVNEVFQESIRLADELGNKIGQVNEGMINFARQGFEGKDLAKMTEVATLMANVSDMTVDESADVVTSVMKGFNMEAEDTLHIVNALNNVDNSFAVSTQTLGNSLMKATGAANTYGVSMENLIGHATAVGEVTRESGWKFFPAPYISNNISESFKLLEYP